MYIELFIGILMGLASGFFGIGGGFIAIPLFRFFLDTPAHIAIGTSLSIVAITAVSGASTYIRKKKVDFRLAITCAIPGILFSVLGAYLSGFVAEKLLMALVVVSIFFVVFAGNRFSLPPVFRSTYAIIPIGAFIGFMSGLLGIGGGFLLMPFFLLLGLGSHRAVGTSLVTLKFYALSGAIIHFLGGRVSFWLFLPVLVGAIIGSQISGRMALKLPEDTHSLLLRVFFAILGIFLIVEEFL